MEKAFKKPATVVALDIGTTKVCVVIGRKNEHGQLEILGYGKEVSEGVSRGVVSNIEKTVNAISSATDRARKRSEIDFDWVHVGIAGQHIKTLQHRGLLTRESNLTEICCEDITRLENDMQKLVLPPGDKIIHVIPQEYLVDDEPGISDPIGMSGVRLEANYHIITGQITATNNIIRVALVDIGGGTTDLTIFHEGVVRHTAVIPFGGTAITKDIKEGCTVMPHQAEKLKVKFGAALANEVFDNRIISIPGLKGREPKEISEKNLARIIQARVEEILDYVIWEIQRAGFDRKLIGGIVLTGGGALLKDIDKLTEFHTGMSTRISVFCKKESKM